ncbi:MAG: LodA/GoxA family CTQ-dependent oxidase [Candidatus Cybelea sp.]
MPNLKTVKIVPAIGIARIGNSPEWYLGPELPFPATPPAPPDGQYKDFECRIRRQAQRFRLWGFFDDNSDRELTLADGTIQWTVHLANAKAVNYGEPGGLIDPGPRTLNGANDSASFANGTYTYEGEVVEVPLGDAFTDADGRLIVAGGFGFSSTPIDNNPLGYFLNTPGWHDDVADGPINATIVVGGQTFNALGAWVICPPPRYAPTTYSPISLYDTLREVAIEKGLLASPGQPSFTGDIWPILTRGIGMLRVAAATFGPGDHDTLSTVIPPGAGQDTARANIFARLKKPDGSGGDMPLLYDGGEGPAALRQFQYDQMQSWSAGTFTNDWPPVAPTTITPDGLTQAALENCVGAPFYPGIEATLTVSDGTLAYVEAFRFDQSGMNPGDVTKAMARPWQNDFSACTGNGAQDSPDWWPAARPDWVYPEGSSTSYDWSRDIAYDAQSMVDNWFRLGFVLDPGNGLAVEEQRTVVCKDCFIVTDRNEIAEEEAAALILANESIVDAFFVVVEGFAPSDLSITTANPTPTQLQAWAPAITFNPLPTQMSQQVDDMFLEAPGSLGQVQRITFGYSISFTGTNDFSSVVVPIELTATIGGVSSNAEIDLTPVDAPYMDHGPISWLSNDARVFKLQPGEPFPGTSVTLGSDPNAFIQNVIGWLRGAASAQAYQTFEQLPSGEDAADLEWLPTLNNAPVYNFALCRVRYRATMTKAKDVRVFFRLFQTAATGTDYDPSTTYRVGGQPGVRIAKLGIQGGELVTIPFFADARNPATSNLNLQKDATNKHTIQPAGGGEEGYMYFGCWLDINQPNDARFPIQPSPPDGGPFTGQLLSIADLIRGTHQCMVTEINYDLDPTGPPGISTASSDKLSQRNLAIDHSSNPGSVETRRVQHTFAIHPTAANLPSTQQADELMIVWGNVPPGTPATIYLPGCRSSDVLALAGRSFNLQTLARIDDYTLGCKTGGVTYVPIPSGDGLDLAGLITLELPPGVRRGQTFRIVARQIVDAPAPLPRRQPPPRGRAPGDRAQVPQRMAETSSRRTPTPPRHILGSFGFSVQVKSDDAMLVSDERALTAIGRVVSAIPLENRWYPVMQRYHSQLQGRVRALGGKPPQEGNGERWASYEGKISGLIYDRFGEFEGFIVDTEEGRHTLRSRERDVEELVRFAWSARVAVRVLAEWEHREELRSIILLRPPADFDE